MTITIDSYMSAAPHTVGQDQSLAAARDIMRRHGIRHLPVLAGGRLTGVVSERDIALIEGLPDVDSERVSVSEAMTSDIFTVSPSATVREVASQMAERKYGCAIVTAHDRVVGVFTTIDALRALSATQP